MKRWARGARELATCLWRLRPHLRGGRYLVGAVVATSLAGGLFEGVGVSLLVPLLSLVLGGEDATPMRPIRWLHEWMPGHSPTFYILVFCVLVLGSIAVKNAILYLAQLLASKLRRRVATNLRLSLFERLHHAELRLFEQHPAGELANLFFTETTRTVGLLDFLLLFGQRASIGAFYFMMLLYISVPLTLITLGLAGFIGWTVRSLFRHLAHRGREISDLNQKLASRLLESFAGIRVVRSTHSQVREIEKFQAINSALGATELKVARTTSLLLPITETVAVAGAMSIIGCAYVLYVRPGHMLSSYLLGFGFILLRLLPLINQLYQLQSNVVYFAEGARRVGQWLQTPAFPIRPFGEVEFEDIREDIRLEDVSYTYPNGTQALQGVSVRIPAGQTVALVGASGSGKSTLTSLLLRLREPDGGRIRVDGRDYWEFTAESWHNAVGVVEQEAFLFHDSMAQNIGYGFPAVSPEAIRTAVRVALLEDVVETLPEGLDTVVGERGMMLSGGQRQRLAIARAIVRDPRLLILDEATSSLDSVSERHVQEALEAAVRGRTVLVIAHRLSTIRNADWIVVLDKGRAAEQGPWDALVAQKGLFWQLVSAAETDRSGLH